MDIVKPWRWQGKNKAFDEMSAFCEENQKEIGLFRVA